MDAIITKCLELEHPQFCVEFDSAIPRVDADVFVAFLEQSVRDGVRYDDGQTIQLGSMVVRLVLANKYFKLQEPDLRHFPIAWRHGVTQSLRLLRLQKDIAESVGLGNDLDFPSIRQSLLTGTDLSKGADGLYLERLQPTTGDSGWFVGKSNSQLDYTNPINLRRLSIYQAILNWPRISGVLALPAGSRVKMLPTKLEIYHNGNLLKIQTDSFLDAVDG